MTEAEWYARDQPGLFWLDDPTFRPPELRASERRLRLFACACCRRVWDWFQTEASRRLVELSEAYADGEITQAELLAANDDCHFPRLDEQYRGEAGAEQLPALTLHAIYAARWLADESFSAEGVASWTGRDRK